MWLDNNIYMWHDLKGQNWNIENKYWTDLNLGNGIMPCMVAVYWVIFALQWNCYSSKIFEVNKIK